MNMLKQPQLWTIGVDIGGSKIALAKVDASGVLGEKVQFPVKASEGPDVIISQIADAVHQLIAKVGSNPLGIGIGVAGQIHAHSGTVCFAPNLQWKDVPLRTMLRHLTGLPVFVLNDVRCAAWGEWLYGAGAGVDDLVCMFVGTGIGGGIVSGSRMLHGSSNSAGEIGHITIDLYGPACTCGNTGCLEALASGWAIAHCVEEAIAADPTFGATLLQLNGGKAAGVTASLLREASLQGDALAKIVIEEVTLALIAGAVSLINAFNPRKLILGGGVVMALPEIVEGIKLGVKQKALAVATADLDVVAAHLGDQAGVIGAAVIARGEVAL